MQTYSTSLIVTKETKINQSINQKTIIASKLYVFCEYD